MTTSFGAVCNDFYINGTLGLKLDLPNDRETLLHLFDRVRKSQPEMNRLKRYEGELALESARPTQESEYRWLALRRNNIRTGHVNPRSMAKGYELQRLVLELSPYHLSISPLDVSFVELLFGFDLECKANHDEVVYDALFSQSPVALLLRYKDAQVSDVQPLFGMMVGDVHCSFDVKTRLKSKRSRSRRFQDEPISILLTLRKYGPVQSTDELLPIFDMLASKAEQLAADQLIPHLLTPIARQITSSNT